jgi:phage tail sheath protein FI
VTITQPTDPREAPTVTAALGANRSPYLMYYGVQHFFANGGGDCYIVSVGDYTTNPNQIIQTDLIAGLNASALKDEITLIVFPDAQNLGSAADYYGLYNEAMEMCRDLQDRFTIMDVWPNPANVADPDADIEALRSGPPGAAETDTLKYGAAYYPNLETTLDVWYGGEGIAASDQRVTIVHVGGDGSFNGTLAELRGKPNGNTFYFMARAAIRDMPFVLPASPAMAGVYADVDDTRGVWKAPANVNVDLVIRPTRQISDHDQESLNVDPNSGKSINCIRSFTGRGNAIVWGARTLAGNDNEWRYISVRRFFNMVEESTRKATAVFVFEPNDRNTWVRVKAMIENFLILQWRAGALAGAVPEHAFFVKVGLGETMTAQDILEGYMIVEIGMAVVRPAEFIVLKFSHKMQES